MVQLAAGSDHARPKGRGGVPIFCMTTLTGILEWPQRTEGRVRQLNGSTLIQRDDDPFVPLALGDRYKLRNGLEVTVTVGFRSSRARTRMAKGTDSRTARRSMAGIGGITPTRAAAGGADRAFIAARVRGVRAGKADGEGRGGRGRMARGDNNHSNRSRGPSGAIGRWSRTSWRSRAWTRTGSRRPSRSMNSRASIPSRA